MEAARGRVDERSGRDLPPVLELNDAADAAVEQVGLKARNLGRLSQAGLPVPRGVVLPVDPWRVAHSGAALPAPLAEALGRAVQSLGAARLAVRSSSPGEDRPDASAAGVFATELDVAPGDVLSAARACWASCEGERARAYHRDLGQASPGMAVIVQRMVPATAAGVLFTRVPGPDAERVLLEAVPGTGEALVDGRVDPVRVALARDPAAAGPLQDSAGRPLLTAAAQRELVARALDAEALFGCGVDVEWAVEGDRVWLLQARPITRDAGPGGEGRVRWTSANTQEALLEPVTPLSWSLLSPLVEAGRRDLFRAAGFEEIPGQYMRLFYGLPYFNPDYFRSFLRQVPGAPENVFDALIFGEGAPQVDVRLRELLTSTRTLRLLALLGLLRLGARERFELFAHLFAWRLRRLERRPLEALADAELVALRGRATALLAQALRRHVLGTAISGAGFLLLDLFLRRSGVVEALGPGLATHLTAGAPGNAVAAASERLETLARRIAEEAARDADLLDDLPELARVGGRHGSRARARLAREFDDLLAAFGHRCENEAELLEPRWSDDPAVLLGVIRSTVLAVQEGGDALASLRADEAALPRRARRLARRVAKRLRRGAWVERVLPVRRAAFWALLREARRYAPYRENLKDRALRALHLLRRAFLVMGQRLAERGRIERTEDVFFLEVAEVEAALLGAGAPSTPLRELVAARRAERAANLARRPPRYVVDVPGHPPRPVFAASVEESGLLEGAGVSGGRRTATARVLRGLEDAVRLGPGEVLVARVVNAAWTPLFHLAGAIVAEVGGVLSHGAIVAREYGIPAVFGAAGATSIPDGATVTVDGDLGIVTVDAVP